jgi:hydroxymethylbilane synthase
VKRLGWAARITEILSPEISLPAIGQGAVGIECRIDDKVIHDLISPLNHYETEICVRGERACLRRLEGGCQVPIAAHARLIEGKLVMDGLVGSVSGDRIIRARIEGRTEDAKDLGKKLAEDLLSKGADKILAEVYGRCINQIDPP